MNIQAKRIPWPEPLSFDVLWPQHKRSGRIKKTARTTHGPRLENSGIRIIYLLAAHPPENLSQRASKDIACHTAREKNQALSLEFKPKSPESEHSSKFLHFRAELLTMTLYGQSQYTRVAGLYLVISHAGGRPHRLPSRRAANVLRAVVRPHARKRLSVSRP
jgi:hypothetical protein